MATGLPKEHLDSNAGAIWSLASSPDGATLAIGCEDGTTILIDVADGSFAYSRVLERQSSRVLSLSWHPNGKTLVGGCADSTIRAWDVSHPHGRIIAQMKVEQSRVMGAKRKRTMNTLVWAVKVTSDGTVISGDSTGSLKIWESRFWSLTQSFQVHKGDILCLAIDSVSPGTDTDVGREDYILKRTGQEDYAVSATCESEMGSYRWSDVS
jgi:U3 small nucleolar RNA-associated protein 4